MDTNSTNRNSGTWVSVGTPSVIRNRMNRLEQEGGASPQQV
jgi:hypothetical protein